MSDMTPHTVRVKVAARLYEDLRPLMESHTVEDGAAQTLGDKWLAVPASQARTFTLDLTPGEIAELVADLKYREDYHLSKYRADDADRATGLAARRLVAKLEGAAA